MKTISLKHLRKPIEGKAAATGRPATRAGTVNRLCKGPSFTHNRTAYLTPGFFVQTAFYYGSSRNSFVFLLFLASILMASSTL